MLVTIRLFARLKELAGASELRREVPDQATVRTVWELLAREYPAIAEYERSISAAVNDDYARLATTLRDGDEVAFLPPVSGGKGNFRP
jgi:molybdopterin converting factor subunit 1